MGWRNRTLESLKCASTHLSKAVELASGDSRKLEPASISGHAIRVALESVEAALEALDLYEGGDTSESLARCRLSDIAEADLPESKPAPKPAVPDSAAAHLPLKVGHSYKPRIPVYRKKITIVLVENDLALGSDGTNYDARTGRFHKGATAPATQWDLVAEVFDDAPSD